MSELCHICGPVKHEAPTVICAPCVLALEVRQDELIELRTMRAELKRFRDRWLAPSHCDDGALTVKTVRRHIDDILALAPSSGCADGAVLVSGAAGGPRKADSAPPAGDLCARCGLVPLKPGQSSDELDVCDACDAQIRADIAARQAGAEST